jgi:hypothetical protein
MLYLASFIVFLVAVLFMAVGVLLGEDPLRRGCGTPLDCHCGTGKHSGAPRHRCGRSTQ